MSTGREIETGFKLGMGCTAISCITNKAAGLGGGAYSETVTGTDNYTLVDNGNVGTTKYTRTIDGSGTYNRTDTGTGATLPTDSGTISYHWEQTGDPRSGSFDLTQSGTDRYDLLEDFKDVSNTQAGQTPGHMNVYPFGQPFVDPPPRADVSLLIGGLAGTSGMGTPSGIGGAALLGAIVGSNEEFERLRVLQLIMQLRAEVPRVPDVRIGPGVFQDPTELILRGMEENRLRDERQRREAGRMPGPLPPPPPGPSLWDRIKDLFRPGPRRLEDMPFLPGGSVNPAYRGPA